MVATVVLVVGPLQVVVGHFAQANHSKNLVRDSPYLSDPVIGSKKRNIFHRGAGRRQSIMIQAKGGSV